MSSCIDHQVLLCYPFVELASDVSIARHVMRRQASQTSRRRVPSPSRGNVELSFTQRANDSVSQMPLPPRTRTLIDGSFSTPRMPD